MAKILVIEDAVDVLENVLEMLECEEFESYGASSGAEGIAKAKELRPDLIICDVMMPKVDGYQVLIALQDDPTTATIPFVFLSANAALKDIRRGMNLGALDYLTKPFEVRGLLQVVRSRLEIADRVKRLMREREETVRRQMLREIPDSFGNLLNAIIGSLHIAESENENIAKLCDQLIPKMEVLIETESKEKADLFKNMVKAHEVIKLSCSEQSKSLNDGLEASGKFYSLLQSLFRSIERI